MTDTDIVERLRDAVSGPHANFMKPGREYTINHDTPGILLHEAAAEIERLRSGGCARDQGLTQFCAEAVRLAAEVERLKAGGWRPIDTAPRDGTPILGYFPDATETDGVMLVAMLEFEGDPAGPEWWQAGNDTALDVEPSLWQPLPTPPDRETPNG